MRARGEIQDSVGETPQGDIEEARTQLEEIGTLALMSSDEAAVRLGRLTNLTPQAGNHTMLAEADQEWADAKKNFLDAKEKLDDLNKRISDEDSDTIGNLNKEFGRLNQINRATRRTQGIGTKETNFQRCGQAPKIRQRGCVTRQMSWTRSSA